MAKRLAWRLAALGEEDHPPERRDGRGSICERRWALRTALSIGISDIDNIGWRLLRDGASVGRAFAWYLCGNASAWRSRIALRF